MNNEHIFHKYAVGFIDGGGVVLGGWGGEIAIWYRTEDDSFGGIYMTHGEDYSNDPYGLQE